MLCGYRWLAQQQRTNNNLMEKVIFMSKLKRPMIVVKPMKVNSDNDVVQEPVRVQFDNNFYQTDEEAIINFIKKLPNFGADYWIVENIKPVEDRSPKVGITSMDTPEQIKDNEIANIKKDIDVIKNGFEELKGLIMQVASKSLQGSQGSDDEDNGKIPTTKIDNLAKAREAKRLAKEKE